MLLSFTGCDNSYYKTLKVNKGFAHFSFEYPSHYKKLSIVSSEIYGTRIDYIDKVPSEGNPVDFFYVYVFKIDSRHPSSVLAIEKTIEESARFDNLRERSSVTVDGISAEMITYSHKSGIDPHAPPSTYNIIMITREVYFDYNGTVWNIAIESDEDKAEQAKADFDHILQTFKILD